MGETDLEDVLFTLFDYYFYTGDFLGWVKVVTFFEVVQTYLASLAITEGESKCSKLRPLHFSDGQLSECLRIFSGKFTHVGKTHNGFCIFNHLIWNDWLTVKDRLENHAL